MSSKLVVIAALVLALGALSAGLAAALVASRGGESAEITLPTAPETARVDLAEPSFSHPTRVTNPLHPTSKVTSALLLGHSDGSPLRVEVTLLPETKTIEWDGRKVETLESQYVAFLGGRIHEVALDWYAQADDGSVWYFGEDVFNYADGVVTDTEGTWLAGRDGPAAMIMPARPRVGDVYRPENIPGIVFEEVTVKSVGRTVDGPQGRLRSAIAVRELHMDGAYEGKIFAPGYGEFWTGAGGDLEALALAVPTDALPTRVPAELTALSSGADDVFGAARSGDWQAASAALDAMNEAWATYKVGEDVPSMLDAQMSNALDALAGDALRPAVDARNRAGSARAAIEVARAGLDLQLRHRPPTEVDLARFALWARQLVLDAAANEPARVAGDVATLERVWDRFRHTLDSASVSVIESRLGRLRAAADHEDVGAAAEAAAELRDTLRPLTAISS